MNTKQSVVWKCYGIVTPAGALMLNYIGRTRQQLIDMVTGAHEQDWSTIKREVGWKIIPLLVTTKPARKNQQKPFKK